MGGSENLSPEDIRVRQRRPRYDELRKIKDPCVKESDLTMKCLDDNGYDRDKCQRYFMNYRSCRKFWARVETDRKKKGIQPNMPPLDEREAMKKEYHHLIDGKPG